MNGASSNRGSPALPMKLVATPRPEKNDWKSIVGPWIDAFRPPAHSTWATLSPPRSADWAIVSTCRTFGSNAAVRVFCGAPLMWNVLFVEPWIPGHAPVARVYQPAPVLGGAWVSRPSPAADVPALEELGHRRHQALRRVLGDEILAESVGGEEDRLGRSRPVAVAARRGGDDRRSPRARHSRAMVARAP